MKINTTLVFTLLLLTSMLATGVSSGIVGFTLGKESLKGVSQPDTNPTQKKTLKKHTLDTKKTVEMISETEIIKKAKEQMRIKNTKLEQKSAEKTKKEEQKEEKEQEKEQKPQKEQKKQKQQKQQQ
ncbi:MAG TPA: hypothetical protein V6C58_09430, partial [Allocoleopsis sp.]